MSDTPDEVVKIVEEAMAGMTHEDFHRAASIAMSMYATEKTSREVAAKLADERQDIIDRLGRQSDLAQAILRMDENELTPNQLNRIACIIWPDPDQDVPAPLKEYFQTGDITQDSTQIPTPCAEVQAASSLLWQAFWMIHHIKNIPGMDLGQLFGRSFGEWCVTFDKWRAWSRMEKFETEEMKKSPQF